MQTSLFFNDVSTRSANGFDGICSFQRSKFAPRHSTGNAKLPLSTLEDRLAFARTLDVSSTRDLLRTVLTRKEFGNVAVVSSFGAESVVLLALVAEFAPSTPILFMNTQKLFPDTERYADQVKAELELTNVIELQPDGSDIKHLDRDGDLWERVPDQCCEIRKVRPLERALEKFDTWITGRKRFQGAGRSQIPVFESDGSHLKVNPLAQWSGSKTQAFIKLKNLLTHPLVAQGFPSIGCSPCTARPRSGDDDRAGRWNGTAKTECGIHRTTLINHSGLPLK